VHPHFMQFSWIEDTQPSVDLGYASNDAEAGYVIVKPVSILSRVAPVKASSQAPVPRALKEEYELGGYAGI
jgi:hypothetical protein